MNGSGLLIVRFPELSWDNKLHYSAFEKEARASVLIVEVLIKEGGEFNSTKGKSNLHVD